MSFKEFKEEKNNFTVEKQIEEAKSLVLSETQINELKAFVMGEPSIPALIGLFFVSKSQTIPETKYLNELKAFNFVDLTDNITESGKLYLNSDIVKGKFKSFLNV